MKKPRQTGGVRSNGKDGAVWEFDVTDTEGDSLYISSEDTGFNGVIHWRNLKTPLRRYKFAKVRCTFPKKNWV
jgi:hypothetical protein